MTEPGQPWVMISGSASSCDDLTWMKWMSTPSIWVVNCGKALSFVVMHPMRRVGQALHAVEVGHVVAVGLGEVGAEVGVALPPDDERRRRDRAELRNGFLL